MERELAWLGASLITEDEKRRAEALRLGVPFVTLGRSDISLSTLVLIPEPLSRTANIVAYRHGEEGIEVALLDLADLPQIEYLRKQYRVQVRLTDRGSIKQALLLYQKHLKEKFAGVVQGGKEAAEALLKHALHSGAHYIHVEPAAAAAAGTIVKYRIEGTLREAMQLPQEASRYIVERIKLLARLFPVTTAAQEGHFTFTHNDEEVGVSVSTIPTMSGERMVMRLARQKNGVAGFSLQTLGLHGTALEQVHQTLHAEKGMVLVTGQEGSGKTTLAYTLIDQLSNTYQSIATVEDHVEYRLPNAHQTVTRPDLGLGVASALRAVLKQDPDIVLVGDLASEGAAELALKAAERGIFIIGTMVAQNASEALEILRSKGALQTMLDAQTALVITQQVVRRVCPHAKTRPLTRQEGAQLEGKVNFAKVLATLKAEGVLHEHTAWKDVLFYTEMRCKECASTFVGVQEVSSVAFESQTEQLTLLEDALFKSVQGLTSIEEVVKMAAE